MRSPTRPGGATIEPLESIRPSVGWILQAATGAALLVLLTIHMIAHHFVVDEIGGLRTYEQVLDYVSNPIVVAVEVAFLIVVTWHAMIGLRAVLLDLGLSARGQRLVDRGVTTLGIGTVVYGLWLIAVLGSRT